MPLNDSFGGPKRGMIVREVVALTPRSQIYKVGHRFVHAHRQSDLDVVSTPWWFDSATVKQISETARRCGDSLDVVFRRFGAIAPRWGGSADLIVKAELATTLAAHRGPGTRVAPGIDADLIHENKTRLADGMIEQYDRHELVALPKR